MNQYGRRAQRHWQQHLPTQYARLEDPQQFFTELGETIANQIEDLAEELTGPDRAGESYLGKLGRLNMARTNAETEVFREMLPPPESARPQDDPTTA